MMIAALCHDLGHDGFTNSYHVNEITNMLAQSAQAINNNHPVERQHLATAEEQHVKMITTQVERHKL